VRRVRRGREGRAREGRVWFRLGDDSDLEVLEPGVLLGSGSPGRVGSSKEGGHEDLEKEEEKRRGGGKGGLAPRDEREGLKKGDSLPRNQRRIGFGC